MFNHITSMGPRSVNEPWQPAGVDAGILYLGRNKCNILFDNSVTSANVQHHIVMWNKKAMQEAASVCFLLLLSHILLHNMPVWGGADTTLCLLVVRRPSHIHLNTERGELAGVPVRCCPLRKVLRRNPISSLKQELLKCWSANVNYLTLTKSSFVRPWWLFIQVLWGLGVWC